MMRRRRRHKKSNDKKIIVRYIMIIFGAVVGIVSVVFFVLYFAFERHGGCPYVVLSVPSELEKHGMTKSFFESKIKKRIELLNSDATISNNNDFKAPPENATFSTKFITSSIGKISIKSLSLHDIQTENAEIYITNADNHLQASISFAYPLHIKKRITIWATADDVDALCLQVSKNLLLYTDFLAAIARDIDLKAESCQSSNCDFSQERGYLAECIAKSSGNEKASALTLMGLIYCKSGNIDSGLKYYKDSLVINPDNFYALWLLGEHYLNLACADATTAQPPDILSQYGSLSINGKNAEIAHENSGGNATDIENLNAAINYLSRATQIIPEEVSSKVFLIKALTKTGRLDEAKKVSDQLLSIAPADTVFILDHGSLLAAMGKDREVAGFYEEKIKMGVRSDLVYEDLAKAYARLQEPDKAIATLDSAIMINSNVSRYYFLKAYVNYARCGGAPAECKYLTDADKDIATAIEKSPEEAEYYSLAGAISERCQQFEQAIVRYKKAFELDKGNMNSVISIINIYEQRGQNQEACEYYDAIEPFWQSHLKEYELALQHTTDQSTIGSIKEHIKDLELNLTNIHRQCGRSVNTAN